MKNKIVASLLLLVLALLGVLPAYAADPEIIGTYVLANIPLAELQNQALPDSLADDRGILLGGVGSDLWHSPGDPANVLYMITDRGPNGQIQVDGKNRRTFPVPDFTPIILKVQLDAPDKLTILESLPIVGASGKPVTGMSALARDEKPYDYAAQTELTLNPNGVDSEGLVRTASGDFWLAEEYGPSLLKLDSTGKVVMRYIPQGLAWQGTDYPVSDVLPAIYEKRKGNRGFEGLGLSPDGSTLFAVLQSPLSNPDSKTGDPSRITRILAFDIATEKPVAEYVYEFDVAAEFDPESPKATEMKLSGVIAVSPTELWVLERTDKVAKVYSVPLAGATNILGTKWDEAATAPSLEATTDLAAAGITPLAKTLVVNLDALKGMPDKIEGMARVDDSTLAVANDNDFDMNAGTFDANGKFTGTDAKSEVLLVKLPGATEPAVTTPLPSTGGTPYQGTWFIAGLALLVVGLTVRRIASRVR